MTTDSELLAEIAEDYTVRLRGENQPSIDDYAEKHPNLATEIRRLLPSIRAMEQLSHREHSERKFERKTKRLALAPDGLLGDFKILSEIGRGGMGVVYEAEQQSLKRRVALKILGPTMAGSPKQLARFQSEAKAVAKLHHTNIVSVYGVGEHEGLYYYAMQLIDGMTLSDAIAIAEPNGEFATRQWSLNSSDMPLTERPTDIRDPEPTQTMAQGSGDTTPDAATESPATPGVLNEINKPLHSSSRWSEIARLGACVADALDYAHSNGVLHRDIKPSNLILDRQGVIWITDFGLAHHEDMDGITATGDIVGTVRYMAPEQFDGQFDGRCDTYSLGMTVYEMLTLRPAFSGQPKQIIKLKTTSQPPAPRSINPQIPRDLETIVLKACAGDPQKRYASPAEFAADLRRFLEDRPIHARRVRWRERLYRWARRNPLAAALGVLSLVSITAALAVFSVLNFRLSGAVRELREQKRQVNHSLQVNESRGETSDRVIEVLQEWNDEFTDAVAKRSLPEPIEWDVNAEHHVSLGVLSQSDIATLRDAVKRELSFAEMFGEKVEVEKGAARAMANAGDHYRQLGQFDNAAKCYLDALARFKALLKSKPNSLDFLLYRVRMNVRLEEVRSQMTGSFTVPDTVGISNALQLLQNDPGNILKYNPDAKMELIRTLHSRHYVRLRDRGDLSLIGRPATAGGSLGPEIEESDVAIRFMRELLILDRANSDYKRLSVRIQTDRGRLELLRGDEANATVHLTNAARVLSDLLHSEDNDDARTSLQLELAYVLCLAPVKMQGIKPDLATDSLRLFATRLSDLASADPRATRAQELADAATSRVAQYVDPPR